MDVASKLTTAAKQNIRLELAMALSGKQKASAQLAQDLTTPRRVLVLMTKTLAADGVRIRAGTSASLLNTRTPAAA